LTLKKNLFDRALQRAEAYIKAGADMLFPEALHDLSQYKKFTSHFPDIPILANITGNVISHYFSLFLFFVKKIVLKKFSLSQSLGRHPYLRPVSWDLLV
jgi:hypothetical protein